jgi:arsenate reductase-like glutaredoxin family protein
VRQIDPNATERNYAKTPLTAAEIQALVGAVGSVAALLNTRHEIAKTRGWRDHPPDLAEFVTAAAGDNNLVRRPIVVRDGRAVVGTDEGALRRLLAG